MYQRNVIWGSVTFLFSFKRIGGYFDDEGKMCPLQPKKFKMKN